MLVTTPCNGEIFNLKKVKNYDFTIVPEKNEKSTGTNVVVIGFEGIVQ